MKENRVAWLVGPILLLLGLAILVCPRLLSLPSSKFTTVEAGQIDPAPLRQPLGQPPSIEVAVVSRAFEG